MKQKTYASTKTEVFGFIICNYWILMFTKKTVLLQAQ